MGSALLRKSFLLVISCILNAELNTSQAMEGIFQDYGNEKTQRFPVYHTVKGFDIQVRFSTKTCTGQLVEIMSKDTDHFLRITLLDIGLIRMSFSTPNGQSQLNLAMPSKGGFCNGKRHSVWLSIYRGVVSYGVDKVLPKRFYVAHLRELFSSPENIIIGKGLQGCVSGSTVVLRVNKTHEYRVGTSSGCSMAKSTTRSPKQMLAQKIAIFDGPDCKPLTFASCKTLGYNLTQVPNHLQHKTYSQAAAELGTFMSKLQPQCSPHLMSFLCQLYLPPCIPHQSSSPPCRSLCESVQEGCSTPWPSHLNCTQFPRATDNKKCFLGSAKVTTKRTTLMRGTITKNEKLTETNSLKNVIKRNPIISRKAEESTTETTSVKTDARFTKQNQGKDTLLKSSSTLTSEMDLRVSTTAVTESTIRQTASFLSSVMTGTQSKVVVKEKLEKHSSTAAPLVDKNLKRRNETNIDKDSIPKKTENSRWNFSTPVLSAKKTGICGGVLMSVRGQFMSPGYPTGYPSNTTCRWSIILPSDYHLISFTFHKVYLEEDRNCVYDYIAVYDMLDNEVGQRYCGSITSPIVKHVKGNVATVVFHSDFANSKRGFILSYKGRKCHDPSVVEPFY